MDTENFIKEFLLRKDSTVNGAINSVSWWEKRGLMAERRQLLEKVKYLSNECSWAERIYCLRNSIVSPILCVECKKNAVKWHQGIMSYVDFCSLLCSKQNSAIRKKIRDSHLSKRTTEDIIERAQNIHGSRYNYSKAVYRGMHSKIVIICPRHGEFRQMLDDHLQGKGCRRCAFGRTSSKLEKQWIKKLDIDHIQEQKEIVIDERRYLVDGYDAKTNTIYEFFGDYYHGNPERYDSSVMNTKVGKSFGELHKKTINRVRRLRNSGYNVIYIWENDFLKGCI